MRARTEGPRRNPAVPRGLPVWLRATGDLAGGRIAGLVLGLAGGWFGVAAGFLLGLMVDLARAGRSFRAYLREPGARRPPECAAGLAAAAALALGKKEKSGAPDVPLGTPSGRGRLNPGAGEGRRLFEAIATGVLASGEARDGRNAEGSRGLPAAARRLAALAGRKLRTRQLAVILDAAETEEGPDHAGLARDLALRGSHEAWTALARFSYAEARAGVEDLDHGSEAAIRARLADSGCPPAVVTEARRAYFPDYRDAWELLGLAQGADGKALKKAWRARCRSVHPDLRLPAGQGAEATRRREGDSAGARAREAEGTDPSADFRRLRQAYDYLAGRLESDPGR